MNSYTAPLQDMNFVLNELADLPVVATLPGYEDAGSDTAAVVLEEAAKFASQVLAPINTEGDRIGCTWKEGVVTTPPGSREAYEQFCAGGWNGLNFPPEFGGQGLPKLLASPVQEAMMSSNLAFSLCPLLTSGAIEALLFKGSDAQKQRYLPRMVAGTWTGTMNLTEPQAGSDLGAIRTRAIPEGAGYRIHGQKIFITHGEHDLAENIVHLVLARLPDAPEGVKGISLFIVPKYVVDADGIIGTHNDLRCASIEHKLGIHASPTAVMAFGDGEGAFGELIGEPNRGLEYMFVMMNEARFAVGLQGVAIAERAYQQAHTYAHERIQGKALADPRGPSVAIIQHPDVRRMLMTMQALTESTRAVAYVIAAALDRARAAPDHEESKAAREFAEFMIPIHKGWATEAALEVANLAIQVHGGMGFIEETGVTQHFRDARILSIYEGTTGIQANDLVGRKIVRDAGITAKTLSGRIRSDLDVLANAGHADSAICRATFDGLDSFERCVQWILNTASRDMSEVYAGAVPFLRLCGLICGGWQLARSTTAAVRMLEANKGDASFLREKLNTATFYAYHLLSQVPGLERAICHSAIGTREPDPNSHPQ